MQKSTKKTYKNDGQDKLLPRLSLAIFDRSRLAAIVWLCLTVFGIFSYTTLLQREGFPSVNVPFSLIQGTYFVNDPAKVDKQVAKPISDIVLADKRVKNVQTTAQGSFYFISVQYTEATNAEQAGKQIEQRVKAAGVVPAQATAVFETPKFGFTERGDDAVVSLYTKDASTSLDDLVAAGQQLTTYIKQQNIPDLDAVSVIDPYVHGTDPASGQLAAIQTKFDRYGERQGQHNKFFSSVAVGLMQRDGTDVIKFDQRLRQAVASYNATHGGANVTAVVSASYAPDIKDQIGELQRALLEGLLAILVIGSVIIAIRASLITVIAMLTVLAIAIALLYLIGQTLNTITLFSLILCLGLIVDDTIIMVEAIDAQRRRRNLQREIVQVATRKVSRAMVAATLTAALSFAPLLFVGGVLGSFIRAIPITVILSLLVSLAVALVFIPIFARYLLLGKKQLGAEHVHEPVASIEAKVAAFVAGPMLWARRSTKKLFGVGIVAVLIGFAFIGAGGYLFQKVTFNIFPPSKDSNGITMQLDFAPGTTIQQAEAVAGRADKVVGDGLGGNFRYATYYNSGSTRSANLVAYITPYSKRDVRAPQLVDQLKGKFKEFDGAKVTVRQLDVGPPASSFSVWIQTNGDRVAALRLAQDINSFLQGKELVRPSGQKARVASTTVSDPGVYTRAGGTLYVEVSATFDATDTSTLVLLAQDAVKKEFTAQKLAQYGLDHPVLQFDFGQEKENQDSFKTLALAFPVLLLAIYLLLALQFRSLMQPLLIFMAIPFSLFGITLGLYLTDNAFSFFAMLGFFALIGLSIKNTILLTDYANQLRRTGSGPIDAAVGALEERFRPLVATSLTAVASLVPLALASPFWEGLAVVLIFGLLSSTFLVITVFPYYYLGAEYLRSRVSRRAGLLWFGLTILVSVVLIKLGANPGLVPICAILVAIALTLSKKLRRKSA